MWVINNPEVLDDICCWKDTHKAESGVLIKSNQKLVNTYTLHLSYYLLESVSIHVNVHQIQSDFHSPTEKYVRRTLTEYKYFRSIPLTDLLKLYHYHQKYRTSTNDLKYIRDRKEQLVKRSLKFEQFEFRSDRLAHIENGKTSGFDASINNMSIEKLLNQNFSFNLNPKIDFVANLHNLVTSDFLDHVVNIYFFGDKSNVSDTIYFNESIDINTFISLIDDSNHIKGQLRSMIFNTNNRQKLDLTKFGDITISDALQLNYKIGYQFPSYVFQKMKFMMYSNKLAQTLYEIVKESIKFHKSSPPKSKPKPKTNKSRKKITPDYSLSDTESIEEQDTNDPQFAYSIPPTITPESKDMDAELLRYHCTTEILEYCLKFDESKTHTLGQKITEFNRIGYSRIHRIHNEGDTRNLIRYLLVPPGYEYKYTQGPIIYHDFYIPAEDLRLPKIVLIEYCN